MHVPHPELGYAPLAGARGAHTFTLGEPVPMRYDERGFRAPVGRPSAPLVAPLVLALGCSFTYGDACLAEQTFPQLVADELGGTALNGGVCGWGLAQMLLRAREVIPALHPDLVLVQDSPWLLGRSLKPFARHSFGRKPVPYFVDAEEGGVAVHPPLWSTNIYDLPLDDFYDAPPGAPGFASFLWRVGLPFFFRDDAGALLHTLGRTFGTVAAPTTRRKAALDLAYGELAALCRENGARLVLVRLALDATPLPPSAVQAGADVTRVDGQAALLAALPEATNEAFERAFGHWRGDPPRLVDRHPNPAAHALLARAVLDSL